MEVPPGFYDTNESRLYNYIVQHFIATLMGPCKYKKINTELKIGNEFFTYKGTSFVDNKLTYQGSE